MKKIFRVILLLCLLLLVGCETTKTRQYKVDLSNLDEQIYIQDFDISLIKIKVTEVDGTISYIDCNESMFTLEDYNLLQTVGTHTVTVIYKLYQEQITITLLDKNEDVITYTYEIDLSLINQEMNIDDFELEYIRIKEISSNGNIEYIRCDKSMISSEDLSKLNQAGTHTITINYKDLKEQITITLKEKQDDTPVITYTYEVDITQVGNTKYLDEFSVSLIRIKETSSEGDVRYIDCDESMLSSEDLNKLNQAGTHKVTINYKDYSEEVTIILFNKPFITYTYEIDLSLLNKETNIDDFELEYIRIKEISSNGNIEYIRCDKSMISSEDLNKLNEAGTHTITINYKDYSEEVTINLINKPLITYTYEIDSSLIKNEILLDDFDINFIKIKIISSNGHIEYIDCDNSMLSSEDLNELNQAGTHKVTINYKDYTEEVTIKLVEKYQNQGQLKVYFVNVGQADCSLIILPNGKTIMIDAGLDHATIYGDNNFQSWQNITKILSLENITTLDYFVITHNHADHYYYAVNILNGYDVKSVYMSGTTSTNSTYRNILSTINRLNIPLYEVSVGQKIIDDKGLVFQVAMTQKLNNPSDTNKASVVTQLTYGSRSFLFMGDAGTKSSSSDGVTDGEHLLLKSNMDLDVDVLKVGHHGSSAGSSNEFLQKVTPTYSVITSSSISTTGHPHSSTLSRLIKYSTYVLQSKTDGTILFVSDGISLEVQKHIGE